MFYFTLGDKKGQEDPKPKPIARPTMKVLPAVKKERRKIQSTVSFSGEGDKIPKSMLIMTH